MAARMVTAAQEEISMTDKTQVKRLAGKLADDGSWLVLTESTGQQGVGYTHKCGAEIKVKMVPATVYDGVFPLSGGGEVETHKIPCCPNCEE